MRKISPLDRTFQPGVCHYNPGSGGSRPHCDHRSSRQVTWDSVTSTFVRKCTRCHAVMSTLREGDSFPVPKTCAKNPKPAEHALSWDEQQLIKGAGEIRCTDCNQVTHVITIEAKSPSCKKGNRPHEVDTNARIEPRSGLLAAWCRHCKVPMHTLE